MDEKRRIEELERRVKEKEDAERAGRLEIYARDLLRERGLPANSLELVMGSNNEETARKVDRLATTLSANQGKPQKALTELERLKAEFYELERKTKEGGGHGGILQQKIGLLRQIQKIEKQGG